MVRTLLSVVVLGIGLMTLSGCGMTRGGVSSPAPAKAKKAFAVEGMKAGNWQVVASYPSSRDAMRRADDVSRGGDFQAVRIRSVAMAAQR